MGSRSIVVAGVGLGIFEDAWVRSGTFEEAGAGLLQSGIGTFNSISKFSGGLG